MNERAVESESSASAIAAVTLLLAVGYAVLRYHIVGPVPWKDFPLFILNKGLCLAGFVLLAFNFSLGPLHSLGVPVSKGWLGARKALGMTGFLLVLINALIDQALQDRNTFVLEIPGQGGADFGLGFGQ